MNSMMDAMQVLKVPRNADFLQIKQAYRQAALRYHPDSALGSSNAEKFQKVTEAFQYLRKAFDAPSSRKNHSNPDFFANHERNKEEEATQAVELSLEELINCVEFSPDEHVRQVALETIASRRECLGFQYLQGLLSRNGFEEKMEVIRALGQPGLEPAREMLIPLVGCKDLMVSAAAIRSLERICLSNRTKIIESLNRELSGGKRLKFSDRQSSIPGKTGGPVDTNPPTQPRSARTRPAFAKTVSSTPRTDPASSRLPQHPRTPTRGFDPKKLQIQLIPIW